MAGVTIAALTGSDSAPSKANEASQKQDIGAAKDDVSLAVTNAITDAYQTAYVETGVSAGEASTKVGTEVIKAIAQKYQTNNQIGNATIEIDGFGTISNVTGDAKVTISTTDFLVEGTIYKDGGKLTWGEILPNQPSITITNPPESIAVNTTATLTAEIKRTTGNPTITWKSGDEAKATVGTNSGVVTGVAEGNVTITAEITIDGTKYSGSCQITIISPPRVGDYIVLGNAITGVGTKTGDVANEDDWVILYDGRGETDNDIKGLFCILADYLPNNNSVISAAGLNAVSGKTYNVKSTSQSSLIESLKPSPTGDKADVWKSLVSSDILGTYYSSTKVYGALTGNEASGVMDKIKAKNGSYYRPHTEIFDNCSGYWLASPKSGNDVYYAEYRYSDNLLYNYYAVNIIGIGVCPVVILPSNISLTKTNGVWHVNN